MPVEATGARQQYVAGSEAAETFLRGWDGGWPALSIVSRLPRSRELREKWLLGFTDVLIRHQLPDMRLEIASPLQQLEKAWRDPLDTN